MTDDDAIEGAVVPDDESGGLAALLGGLGGDGDGGLDIGSLLQGAMDMQQQLVAAQEATAASEVTGRSGGGAVEIDVTGGLEFRAVRITPEAVDPDDVEMLQDLVLAALHDATRRIAELQQGSMDAMPGLDALGLEGMPGLGGMGLDALGLGPDDDDDDDDAEAAGSEDGA